MFLANVSHVYLASDDPEAIVEARLLVREHVTVVTKFALLVSNSQDSLILLIQMKHAKPLQNIQPVHDDKEMRTARSFLMEQSSASLSPGI